MPTYLDRHFVEGATLEDIILAHQKDLAMQDKFGVQFITYWFDEIRCTSFCLVKAPNKEAVIQTHEQSHGMVPYEIIEVDPIVVESFLGRIADPVPMNSDPKPAIGSAFRAIMFTDLKDSTMMTTMFGDTKALHLLHIHNAITRKAITEHKGNEIKHTGDGFMVSFTSAQEQVQCAIAIQQGFAVYNQENPDEELYIRIGLSTGEPIEDHGDLFGTAVQLAARLCTHAEPSQIVAAEMVKEQCTEAAQKFTDLGEITPKGFKHAIPIYKIGWA